MTFRLGAHVSIGDGFDAAIDQQQEYGGNCGQVFVGSPRTWSVSDVDPDEAEQFRDRSAAEDMGPWIVHGTYLINFATPKDDLATKSIDAVQAEIDACAEYGIDYYTFHPGSHTGAGVEQGIKNVGQRLSELSIPDSVTILLENTAGGGTSLGTSPEQLEAMIEGASQGYDELGVCIDTAHSFSAGYDLRTDEGLAELLEEIRDTVGMDQVEYLHLNDSKHPFDSNKDEHEHIGEGEIGEGGFERVVNHEDLADLPMILETPVDEKGYAWNIDKIRSLRQA